VIQIILRSNCIRLGLLGALTACLASCNILFPRADPTQYYVLREFPANAAPSPLASSSGLEVLVGPAAIPGYLDRNQVVTALPGNELKVDEFHSWAEPLNAAATRVLAANISHLLDSSGVVPYPEVDLTDFDLRVSILFRRFEKAPDNSVRLEATYTIAGPAASGIKKSVYSRELSIPLQALPADAPASSQYTAIADAMSRALGELSTSIARKVLAKHREELPPPPET
jgi:uncharacterized lipoprotein YmbA